MLSLKRLLSGFLMLSLLMVLVVGCSDDDNGTGTENTAPVAVADNYSIEKNGTLTRTAAEGVLVNDTDVDGDALTASVISDVIHGSLSLGTDGSFTYIPTTDYSGADSFSYHANDGHDYSNTVFVSITVTSPTTIVGGTISSDSTWTLLGSPYIVTGGVIVAGAGEPTLTIEAGVEVRFDQYVYLTIGYNSQIGKLLAQGTLSDTILFTSNQTTHTNGWWDFIRFNDEDGGSILDYCQIEYGGGDASYKGNVVMDDATNVTISHCLITNSESYGIYYYGDEGLANLSNNTITGNDLYAIRMYADQVRGIDGSNSVAGNTQNGVFLYYGDYIEHDATWYKLDAPYVIDGYVTIAGASEPTLTIKPGVEIRFGQYDYLSVGYNNQIGKLLAQGTETDTILFTSNQTNHTNGWWDFIRFNDEDGGSILEYCQIEYGGGDASYKGNVVIDDATNVTISHCLITNSESYGIHYVGDNGLANLSNNTITGNDLYAIRMYADQVRGIDGSNSVAGNTQNGVFLYYGDYIEHDATWYKLDAPYIIDGYVTVAGISEPTLTIKPGVEIRFEQYDYLEVGYSGQTGTLIAAGTSTDTILFTSNQTNHTKGWWDFIRFNDEDGGSRMEYCVVEYGGGDGSYKANVYVSSATVSKIENCEINNSDNYGLQITDGGNPDITGTSFSDNDLEDIYIYDAESGYTGTPSGSPTVKNP